MRLAPVFTIFFSLLANISLAEESYPRKKSIFWSPFASFLLPGFDQWWEGRYGQAGAFSGTAIVGSMITSSALSSINEDDAELGEDESPLTAEDTRFRRAQLGNQIAQVAGGFSAYEAFRSALPSHQAGGGFGFLPPASDLRNTGEVLWAPFQFSYLARPTTFIPLGILAGLAYLQVTQTSDDDLFNEDLQRSAFTSEDAFYAGAISFNAGTHEEAMFRGWLLPVLYEKTDDFFWANVSNAALFAVAHLNTVSVPTAQLAMGYYWGYLTEKNNWDIGEATFIHTWWDVIILSMLYHFEPLDEEKKKENNTAIFRNGQIIRPPAPRAVWLPPLTFTF